MPSIPEKTCVKCSNPGPYYSADKNKAVYCRDCFATMIRHKFSYSLGTNRVYKNGAKKHTLVVYVGDAKSMLLLRLIQYGMSNSNFKRLHIEPKVGKRREDSLMSPILGSGHSG